MLIPFYDYLLYFIFTLSIPSVFHKFSLVNKYKSVMLFWVFFLYFCIFCLLYSVMPVKCCYAVIILFYDAGVWKLWLSDQIYQFYQMKPAIIVESKHCVFQKFHRRPVVQLLLSLLKNVFLESSTFQEESNPSV